MRPIGIMAALHDEIALILAEMDAVSEKLTIGRRDYYMGQWQGRPCVVVLARVGKVAAAATAVTLIRDFDVESIVFTGVAGAVADHVNVGDIIVSSDLLQYDLDASPLFPRYEVPLLGTSRFAADTQLSASVMGAAQMYLNSNLHHDVPPSVRDEFGVHRPRLHHGLIISGDHFVNDTRRLYQLREQLPDALCLEMEGAAVAQICYEYSVPFTVMRTVSDRADDGASIDFAGFLEKVARYYSAGVMRAFLSADLSADL